MKLTFCGKRPQQNFVRMGVVGNNLSDELIMILDKKQGDIDLSDFSPSLKIVNRDLTYADKTQHFIYDTDSDPEKVMLSYIFPRKVTQQGNVDMQIIFEKADGDDPSKIANWVWLRTPDCKVLSVNGKTGAVVLTTSDVAEGENLYFTTARATANFNSNFAAKSVTGLKDGANVVMSTDTITINGGKA